MSAQKPVRCGAALTQALLSRLVVEVNAENSVRGGQNPTGAAGRAGNVRKSSSGSARLSSGGAVQNSPTRDGPANGSTANFTAGRQVSLGEVRGDDLVPNGSVRLTGTRRKCTVRGEADLAEGDGELVLKRDTQGRAVEYRGHGIKTMPLHFTCAGVSATQAMPVAWFGTAEAFRPVGADGAIEGSLQQGIVHWSWRFTP